MTDNKLYIVLENKMLSTLDLPPFSFLLIPAKKKMHLINWAVSYRVERKWQAGLFCLILMYWITLIHWIKSLHKWNIKWCPFGRRKPNILLWKWEKQLLALNIKKKCCFLLGQVCQADFIPPAGLLIYLLGLTATGFVWLCYESGKNNIKWYPNNNLLDESE